MKKILKHLKKNWVRHGFETLVVTVGILGAFTLNTWNQNRKKENLEIQYLQRLKNDLIQDTIYFHERTETVQNAIENNTKAIRMAHKFQNNLKELHEVWGLHTYWTEHLTVQNNTYIELTNAGNLNIIQNYALKIAIIELYREYEAAARHIQEFNEFSTTQLNNMIAVIPIARYYPWAPELFNDDKMFYDSDWAFMNDPTSHEFKIMENSLFTYVTKYGAFRTHYVELESKSKAILEEIEKELNRRSQ